jgi:hypothetical protein
LFKSDGNKKWHDSEVTVKRQPFEYKPFVDQGKGCIGTAGLKMIHVWGQAYSHEKQPQ